jgi:hypothetical protein
VQPIDVPVLSLRFASVLKLGHFLFQIVYSYPALQPRNRSSRQNNAPGEGGDFPGHSSDEAPKVKAGKRYERNAKDKENRIQARFTHGAFPSCAIALNDDQKPCAATPPAVVMAITSCRFLPAVSPRKTGR